MARPLRIQFPGAYYHVTARGDEQKEIFKSGRDRQRFLEYLLSESDRYGIVVHCYCLMTNHYHLFLQTTLPNLSQAMQHLNGSYTTYYNVKRKHVGHLFQGRYRAIVVEADRYAGQLSRYMHLNPVRAGMVKTAEEYFWSSYRAYIGLEQPPPWLNRSLVLGTFSSNLAESEKLYRDFVEDFAGKEYDSPIDSTVASTVLGGEDFVETIMGGHLAGEEERPDLPAVRALHHRFSIESIGQLVAKKVRDPRLARDIALYLCQHYSGEKLKEIGGHFGLGDSGVTKASFRLRKRMEKDQALRDIIAGIVTALGSVQL